MQTDLQRSAGVLLHPTSLPGSFGIGDVGPSAVRWLDWLAGTSSRIWQLLPLGPTGYGDSPYQCFSSAAGNPLLISPELLVEDGLLLPAEVTIDAGPSSGVDYGLVIEWKSALLEAALARLADPLEDEFRAFCEREAAWLDDFTMFMALKDRFDGRPWNEWDEDARLRRPEALATAARWLEPDIRRHAFRQWQFFRQWDRLLAAARERNITIFGDMPLYVAADSADVWSRPDLFAVGSDGQPTLMAGVPPDYFSPTGQLWGNPIYRWDAHQAEDYQWWVDRMSRTLRQVDLVRIDHFRGLADYWEVPAGAATAEVGRWVDGPGMALFDALREQLGSLPLIAEDLGDLSPAVHDLKQRTGLPGMTILQFAWDGDPDNPFLPHLIEEPTVAYTGTHDNDTTVGWFASISEEERARVLDYLGSDGSDIAWDLIGTAWDSEAVLAIAPLQDLLRLPSEYRMNTPGVATGNWQWRMDEGALSAAVEERLYSMNLRTGRGKRRAASATP